MTERNKLLMKRLSIWCTKQYRVATIFYYSGNNLNYRWTIKFAKKGAVNYKIYL